MNGCICITLNLYIIFFLTDFSFNALILLLGNRHSIQCPKSLVLVSCWWWFDWSLTYHTVPVLSTAASTISYWSKIQDGFAFWYWFTQTSWKLAIKVKWLVFFLFKHILTGDNLVNCKHSSYQVSPVTAAHISATINYCLQTVLSLPWRGLPCLSEGWWEACQPSPKVTRSY